MTKGRLATLKPRVNTAKVTRAPTMTVADTRITGRTLQARRFRIWQQSPHCARCGRLVDYPRGFELDHITPLFMGGSDTDDNCQILCVDFEDQDGCHTIKTREDIKGL